MSLLSYSFSSTSLLGLILLTPCPRLSPISHSPYSFSLPLAPNSLTHSSSSLSALFTTFTFPLILFHAFPPSILFILFLSFVSCFAFYPFSIPLPHAFPLILVLLSPPLCVEKPMRNNEQHKDLYKTSWLE